ncbi:hypothetical protein QF035_009112 [Streptomyces umbrinus]|uniref:Uncharacterized protein n=1 Tax=Streptomyces umbrinus TaxID=67370 RepID=A0ABU0T6W5_9ACTN|nr:hypothetical protein [Streptomyces umbrinus]MDQ1031530.1 hypothetical protein [Streptomyces umbrinus]
MSSKLLDELREDGGFWEFGVVTDELCRVGPHRVDIDPDARVGVASAASDLQGLLERGRRRQAL